MHDVIIIGGGASGLMCAMAAARRNRKVVVVDHAKELGAKIRVSGGGRCNFTNIETTPANYLSGNPHFCKSALARYSPWDFVELVSKYGIEWEERDHGQLFCTKSARQIVDMLVAECRNQGVEFRLGQPLGTVAKDKAFTVQVGGECLRATSLVIATGGVSFPKTGASDIGLALARQFGLNVTETRPALVPLTLGGADLAFTHPFRGISFVAELSCNGTRFVDPLLFTHRGLSGPVALQISSYWREGDVVRVDFLPGRDARALFEQARSNNAALTATLCNFWPKRFAKGWAEKFAPTKPLAEWSNQELDVAADAANGWNVTPTGSEGYAKAEVMKGGVDCAELSSKTLESRGVPGLFFVGEVIDVTGHLGGFNLHWAWASGHAAGQAV